MDNIEMQRQIAESKLDPTGINSQLQDLTGGVLGGFINPIEAIGAIKQFSKALETAKKAITDEAIDELQKWPNGFENSNVKIELRNTARRYSFKHIPEWAEKKAELQDIEATAKGALKGYEKGLDMVNSDGEVIQPAKVSGGGQSVFVTLKG